MYVLKDWQMSSPAVMIIYPFILIDMTLIASWKKYNFNHTEIGIFGILGFLFLWVGRLWNLPLDIISKIVWGMLMKFSHVDGIVKLNIRNTFVAMATNYYVIMTSSVVKIRIWSSSKTFYSRIISWCSDNVHKLLFQ